MTALNSIADKTYLNLRPPRKWAVFAIVPLVTLLLLVNLTAVGLVTRSLLARPENLPATNVLRWGIPLVVTTITLSALAIRYWLRLARRGFEISIVGPYAELIEAGDWILRTALGRPSQLHLPTPPGSKIPPATPIQKELQHWLHSLLEDLQNEYSAHTNEVQRDLNLAREFQQAYMDRPYPKIPAVHVEGRLRLEFYHRYQPALALGGDFYNILTLGPDTAGIFISDVMGHGTRSALITAIIRTLIDDLEPLGRNARHFLTEMNRQFCQLLKSAPSPLFASAFYLVADTTARVATFSSAGHPAPFHIRRSVGRISRLDVPMPRGAALGMIPDEKYSGGYCRLIDGDVFIF
ncbi:MAG: SpoIIE family protein phosphatase, partial [Candidatus Hadarchaeum sp.]